MNPCRSLPGEAYTDDAFLRRETDRLISRTWMPAGFAHDLPEPGDMTPVVVAGQTLLLVRQTTGEISVFHNICRHRGTMLVDGPRRGQNGIVCPYHAWAYDINGGLRATPHFSGYQRHELKNLEVSTLSLHRVRSAQWHDWVFVNLDGEAPDFDEHIAVMKKHLAEYDLGLMRHCETVWADVPVNWKLVQENYLEALHLPTVHTTYAEWSPFQKYKSFLDGNFMGHRLDTAELERPESEPMPRFPGATRYQHTFLFPVMKLSVGPDSLVTMIESWQDHTCCRQRIDFYYVGEEGLSERYEEQRRWYREDTIRTNDEDIGILETVHKGMRSKAYRGAVFSPHWETLVVEFHSRVLDAVGEC